MKTIQKPRILKISSIGEHRKTHTKAQIRLEGKWLVTAGLIPEKHVLITIQDQVYSSCTCRNNQEGQSIVLAALYLFKRRNKQ